MTSGDDRCSVRGLSREHGTTSEFPDPLRQNLFIWPGPAGLHSIFRSKTYFESQVSGTERTRLYRDTRSHLCESDSSASRPYIGRYSPGRTAQPTVRPPARRLAMRRLHPRGLT
jgi:hypothetical protein